MAARVRKFCLKTHLKSVSIISNRLSPSLLRQFSHANVEVKTKKFSASLNLPKTKFPIKHDVGKRRATDEYLYEKCSFSSLYAWQRTNCTGPDFVLHDGPPYANGTPHMGHAINKILKDITIRQKLLAGYKIHYVPGWDCHGLPIEQKALGATSHLSNIEIRSKAREFAKQAISNQRNTFRSWGVMADWDNNCYFTNDIAYIKNQLQQFLTLFEKGLVFRDVKPVFWSPSSRTALAEAELEYNPSHHSTAVTVQLPLAVRPSGAEWDGQVFALIWTTTPWTLPANQAVCYNPDLTYCLVKIEDSENKYIVESSLVDPLLQKLGKKGLRVASFPGSLLSEARYCHPLHKERELPFLPAGHVTTDKGTGLVHTAPAHGPDDFLVALRNNISVECIVGEDGCYTDQTISRLRGLTVLGDGGKTVLDLLGEDILHSEGYVHSYPYDWRTKQPVILRASRQWFIDTAAIKKDAIDALEKVQVFPERSASGASLAAQLQRRPYWCISRQRVWGVPIPVLYRRETHEPVISASTVQHYCNLLDRHGTDFWWTLPIEELVNAQILAECQATVSELVRGDDILDIWFDSGISWSSVLEGNQVADLYLEGVDQFTGWFQSSLMTSVALRGTAPYKAILVHGFAVDENGKKMSKSEGNVVDPDEITKGGKNKAKAPAFGVDALRWWVASHGTQHAMVPVSRPVIQASSDAVHKIRLVIRFLLSVLDSQPIPPQKQQHPHVLDLYMLHQLYDFHQQVTAAYDSYQYNRVCTLITNFVTNEVSALYCHLVKDRLYCDIKDNPSRLACQQVVGDILNTIFLAIGPILPYLAEEAYLYHPLKNEGSTLFRSEIPVPPEEWQRPDIVVIMEVLLQAKRVLNKTTQSVNTLELDATIIAGGEVFHTLKLIQDSESGTSELTELLQVASVVLEKSDDADCLRVDAIKSQNFLCERCRKYTADVLSDPCLRCQSVLRLSI